MTPAVRRRLLGATVASIVLPAALGALLKLDLQPGLHDDALRAALLVDFRMIGLAVFGLTLVLTVAIGCWIVAVMRGPERRADAFPPGALPGPDA